GALACAVKAYHRRGDEATSAARPPAARHLPFGIGHLSFLLALWPLLVYAGLAVFMTHTEAAQGRLLFPAILPVALAVAWGLAGWGRCAPGALGRFNRRLAPLVVLAALAT